MAKQTIKVTSYIDRKTGRGSRVTVKGGRSGRGGRRSTAKA